PARSTVISSISKRTDDGHRVLTASEFLQMSGRAGRRGMDEVGYVTVVGTPFQSPEEVGILASSASDPLESKFTPSYSMVLNLLQRFTVEDARELILKSFGYYSSTEKMKLLIREQERINETIDELNNIKCPYRLTQEDLIKYNKLKNTYIEYRKLTNILRKQAKQAGRQRSPEVIEYENKTKDILRQLERSKCDQCKQYKRHIKNLDISERFERRSKKVTEQIENEKDIYWRQFVNLMAVLEDLEYLIDKYPTEKGVMTASIRSENELFFAELILSGIMDGLSPAELAAVVCAVATEEPRSQFYSRFQLGAKARKAIIEGREVVRKVWKVQKKYDVNTPILLNPHYSPLVEFWTNGGEWEELIKGLEMGEGDLVRTFKRTIDLLRQLANMPNVPKQVAQTASIAMECINREPVSEAL
ncbi:MAG TPA: hypothetical protein DDX14_07225, partial [Cyanobacteria bacterium UBA9579]|nr:hypothetical protein [Cyanobacteria bacterium UBA9579]